MKDCVSVTESAAPCECASASARTLKACHMLENVCICSSCGLQIDNYQQHLTACSQGQREYRKGGWGSRAEQSRAGRPLKW